MSVCLGRGETGTADEETLGNSSWPRLLMFNFESILKEIKYTVILYFIKHQFSECNLKCDRNSAFAIPYSLHLLPLSSVLGQNFM